MEVIGASPSIKWRSRDARAADWRRTCQPTSIRNIFDRSPTRSQGDLLAAAKIAGTLLFMAVREAVEDARFFQAVGQAMVRADQTVSGGANRAAIGKAFSDHGIPLGSAAALQPRARLAGATPEAAGAAGAAGGQRRAAAVSPIQPAAIEAELHRRLALPPGSRVKRAGLVAMEGSADVEKYVHRREVSLVGFSERLANVVAMAPEPVLVGGMRRGFAAALGAMPESATTEDEVRTFVQTLLAHSAIAFSADEARAARPGAAGRAAARESPQRGRRHRQHRGVGRHGHVSRSPWSNVPDRHCHARGALTRWQTGAGADAVRLRVRDAPRVSGSLG